MLSKLTRSIRFLTVPALVAVGACDNPVEQEEEHLDEVESVEITDMSDNLIAELHGDHWDFEGGGDALHLHPGEELEVRIFFVAPDGDRFQLPPEGEEFTMQVEIDDPAIAEYEAHGDHGDFIGLAEGETTAEVQVYHGSHVDWPSPGLPIEVVDDDH